MSPLAPMPVVHPDDPNWQHNGDGHWCHRPWWKVAANRCLRGLQPWSWKWVVYTRCSGDQEPPEVLGYGFGRVLHLRGP